MPIQYADGFIQPGETLRYSMTYTPGKGIADGDTLTGTPSVKVYRLPELTDVSSDVAGPPAITGVIKLGSVSRTGNTVYVTVKSMVNNTDYKITFTCDTTLGEEDVEEDLVLKCREL